MQNKSITFYDPILLAVFQVDNDGILTTTAELDREQQFLYRITITAEDMGVPVRSQNANVIITINDVNDNSPVFVEGVTEISQVYEVILHAICIYRIALNFQGSTFL